MKTSFVLLVSFFSLFIFQSSFAQGPPPPGDELNFDQKKVSVAE